MSKEIIEAEVVNEKDSKVFSVETSLATVDKDKSGGVMTFPELEAWGTFLEDEFTALGYMEDNFKIEDRDGHKALKEKRTELNKLKNAFEEERKRLQRVDTQKHKDFLNQAKGTVHKSIDNALVNIETEITRFEKELIKASEDFAFAYWTKYLETCKFEKEWRFLGGVPLDFEGDKDAVGAATKTADTHVLYHVLEVIGSIGINTKEREIVKTITEQKEVIEKDFAFIERHESADRVLTEYAKGVDAHQLDVIRAIETVEAEDKRIQDLAEAKALEIARQAELERQKAVEAQTVQEVQTPEPVYETPTPAPVAVVGEVMEADPIKHYTFEIKGPRSAINHYLMEMQTKGGIQVLGTVDMEAAKGNTGGLFK